jgi:3-oxoacyl-[acyl-carrier-protein] synthase-3
MGSVAEKQAGIVAIRSYLPEGVVDNQVLAASLPGWTAEQIHAKTGILTRHWATEDECASDLAVKAAQRLLAGHLCNPEDIDILMVCTQSPDYLLPATACLVQGRLGLRTDCLAFDFNLGCSGYVYGLAIAKSLLERGLGSRALLITADTYSKFLDTGDRNATLFGDAAAASLIACSEGANGGAPGIGPFVFGTDGSGATDLMAPGSACRRMAADGSSTAKFFMDGPKVLAFTLRRVPEAVEALLSRAGLTLHDVDLFVMHQANRFILDNLQRKLGIPREKFTIAMEQTGNTVSSSIPLALEAEAAQGRLRPGSRVMLVGFGVGYSWAACLVTWR